MTHDPTALEVEQVDRDAAEEATHGANVVSHDGYYELDIDAVAHVFARHRLTALSQARDAALEEGWRPIETAPVDWSTEVDLWVVSQYGAQRITDCRASLSNGKPDWHTRSDEMGWRRITGCGTPTHWRPLPAPPKPNTLHIPSPAPLLRNGSG